MDWIEKFLFDLKGLNEPISLVQMGMIESLLQRSPLDQGAKEQILNDMIDMNTHKAARLINKIKEDYVPSDPKDQWKKMCENGMFN